MGIAVSVVIVSPRHMDFWEDIGPTVEEVLGTQVTDEPRMAIVGSASSCVFDVELPTDFDVRGARAQMVERLPDTIVSVTTSFRESIWAKRRMDVLVAIASGVVVAVTIEGVLPLLPAWP